MKIEITLIVIAIIMLIVIYFSSISKIDSILDRYVNKLSIFTGFLIFVGVLLTYKIFLQQIKSDNKKTTFNIIDRGWLNINKIIAENYNHCPNFIESLYFNWQKNDKDIKIYNNKINKYDEWYYVNYISILIFQSFEDFLTVSDIDETGNYVWICNYLQWVNSPILKNRWNKLKSNFNNSTIQFGDLLFKYSTNFKINNSNDLKKLSKFIIKLNEYKNIINNRINNKHL